MRVSTLALMAALTLPAASAGAATITDRSALPLGLLQHLGMTVAGRSLVDDLPMRVPPVEAPPPGSAAYSPEGVRWGWVDDGTICFQDLFRAAFFAGTPAFEPPFAPDGPAPDDAGGGGGSTPSTPSAVPSAAPGGSSPGPGTGWTPDETGGGRGGPGAGAWGDPPAPSGDDDPTPPLAGSLVEPIEPSPIPVPAAGMMMLAALGGLSLLRGRR